MSFTIWRIIFWWTNLGNLDEVIEDIVWMSKHFWSILGSFDAYAGDGQVGPDLKAPPASPRSLIVQASLRYLMKLLKSKNANLSTISYNTSCLDLKFFAPLGK